MPHRPVEDNAFAVARFFQRGGSFQNYYMVCVKDIITGHLLCKTEEMSEHNQSLSN
jgi:hypothetical protein